MAIVESEGSLVSAHRAGAYPRSSLTLYSGRVEDYAELYRRQPNLRLVVRFLARNIGQLRLKAFRKISPSERTPLEPTHKLARFLKNPTPALARPTTQYVWLRGLIEDLALYDRLFGLKFRNEATGDLSFVRVPAHLMKPAGDSFFWPEKFVFLGNRARPEYAAGDVFYMHGHDPADPKSGLSPAEALRQILAEDVAAGENREQMWRNGARMGGFIQRPKDARQWSPGAKDRFVEDLRAARTNLGADAMGAMLLEDGMEWNPSSFTPKEAEYLGARRLTREEVAAQYFIPPAFVGILENANFSNIKEQHSSLYSDTLGPWLMWLSQEIDEQILPEFEDVEDVYVEFNIEEKLRGRFEEQASANMSAAGAPFMLRNEIRAMHNLPPVAGGDELVVPLNVLVGGQAAPNDTDTSDEPGTASSAAPAAKAIGTKTATVSLAPYLEPWEAKTLEILEGFFGRQSASVLAKLGTGTGLEAAFDADRWDGELSSDLLALSYAMTEELGSDIADEFDGEFDPALAVPYLEENARVAAESINASTLTALDLAETSLDPEADDPLDGYRAVFTVAAGARAAQIARTRATSVGNWARREAADQAGVRKKRWNTRSGPESRHKSQDGEEVGLGEEFSNGAQYPGDPSLGVAGTAGCTCDLTFTN